MFCVKRSSFILTLLVAAVFAGSVASAQSVTPIPVTVCFPIGGSVYQVMYLPQYYTYKYIQPKVKIVGFVESPATTPRGVTLSLAQNGTDCYAYFGPGNSGIATAVNAVMNSLWVAASVTATEFSDRINYPLFNRVIPRVDVNQRAITLLMKQFQWTTINILCTDNTYGQAVTAAIGKILGDVGGQATPSCISQYGTYADAANVVQAALNSPTRVLFISAVTGEAAYVQGIQAINNLDVNRQLIVLFAEPACTGNDPLWKTVPSSFCATFTTTATYDPFWAAFLTRDTKAEAAVVNAIAGSKYSATTANTFSGYSALAADGARLTFQALDTYVGLYGALPPSPAAAVAWLRNQTLLDGFLGPIQIPNGDRLQPTFMRIYNTGLNNVTSIVGNVTSDGNLTLASSLFVLGQQRALANIPPAIDPATSSTSQTSAWIALAVVLAMLLLIFGAAAYMIRQRQLLAVRPMDPAAPFAVMFVGVKNVDEVRDAGDANSAAAFAQVANDLRAAVRASGCYEARRVDESTVMVVAKKVDNVLQCASQLMTSMDRVDWRAVMCHANEMAVLAQVRRERTGTDTQSRRSWQSHTQSAAQRQNSFLERSRDSDNRSAARTHRSRATSHNIAGGAFPVLHVGIHYGFGMIDHDDSLNTVSYVGKVVTHAAEVADVAVAGQILVSRETHEAFESASSSSLGAFERINAWETVAPDTTMFIPATQAAEAVAAMQAAVKRAIDGIHKAGRATTGAGSIAAALQRADAGLSQRRIGALSLHIPALRELSNDVTKIETVADLIAEVTDTATVHRGEIHSMSNGTILITVNAGAPAAQPVARAALIAMEVLEYLDSQQLSGSAGVAGGLALVGRPTQGAAFATFGTAVELAEVAQRMAAKHGLKVCAVDTNSYDDLAARLHVATIDIVPNAGSRDGMSRLLAIVGERDATAGEWLYSVGSATAGIASNEQAWEQVTQLECPSDAAVDTLDQELVNCTSVLWSQLYTTSLRNLRAYMPLLQATAGDGALDRTTFVASLAKSSQ